MYAFDKGDLSIYLNLLKVALTWRVLECRKKILFSSMPAKRKKTPVVFSPLSAIKYNMNINCEPILPTWRHGWYLILQDTWSALKSVELPFKDTQWLPGEETYFMK